MDFNEYQDLAMRTKDKNLNISEQAVLGCLGIAGQGGEFTELIKKEIFHKKKIATIEMQRELGDILWYMALICDAFKWDMNYIAHLNIEKLRQRYPSGFSPEASNNRKV